MRLSRTGSGNSSLHIPRTTPNWPASKVTWIRSVVRKHGSADRSMMSNTTTCSPGPGKCLPKKMNEEKYDPSLLLKSTHSGDQLHDHPSHQNSYGKAKQGSEQDVLALFTPRSTLGGLKYYSSITPHAPDSGKDAGSCTLNALVRRSLGIVWGRVLFNPDYALKAPKAATSSHHTRQWRDVVHVGCNKHPSFIQPYLSCYFCLDAKVTKKSRLYFFFNAARTPKILNEKNSPFI